jgi:hypothetical protein
MYSHGSFISSGTFEINRDEDNRSLSIQGEVDSTCAWEAQTWEYPGSVEYDIDYRTLALWGDVSWRDEETREWHEVTIRLHGKDAESFLSGWGVRLEDEIYDWDDGDYDDDFRI